MSNGKVEIIVDGNKFQVAEGSNLIDACADVGIEIPHFCYCPNLSVSGSCRMCQVEIDGMKGLQFACRTQVKEGMIIYTHRTSSAVVEAQQAVLEFILTNHPLDCTKCDQAGHCKLQDYYFKYGKANSCFKESKEKREKNVPWGQTLIYDAERCIKCTRCIRFCREISETSELGLIGRGNEIVVQHDDKITNPFSGCLAEICPVGAITHTKWRFKSRFWFEQVKESVCPCCSYCCKCRVSLRDNEIVGVDGNGDYLCDKGRYGFDKFLPRKRLLQPYLNKVETTLQDAVHALNKLGEKPLVVFFSPDCLLEEYYVWKRFFDLTAKNYIPCLAAAELPLDGEVLTCGKLVSANDSACNFRGMIHTGLLNGELKDLNKQYASLIEKLKRGVFQQVVFIGDRSILSSDIDNAFLNTVGSLELSLALVCDATLPIISAVKIALPARTIFEKSGSLLNREGKIRNVKALFSRNLTPEWQIVNMLLKQAHKDFFNVNDDEELMLFVRNNLKK